MGEFISNITFEKIVALATLFGVTLAFLDYYSRQIDSSAQIIKLVRVNLKNSGDWASFNNEGYIGEPSETIKITLADPLYLIYEVENSALKEISIQPGIVNFTENFLNNLTAYNQMLSRIKNLVDARSKIATNNFSGCKIILDEIAREKSRPEIERSLSAVIGRLNRRENDANNNLLFLFNTLYNYNKLIHYDLIGSRNSGGLKTIHHELVQELEETEEKVKNNLSRDILFIIILIVVVTAVSFFFNIKFSLERIIITLLIVSLFYIKYKEYLARKFK